MQKAGSIILIRHGKPDFPYTNHPAKKISSQEFNRLIGQYDASGLQLEHNRKLIEKLPASLKEQIRHSFILVSDLRRAIETAELLFEPQKPQMQPDSRFREVPLPEFKRDFYLPARTLLILARMRWYFGARALENKKDALLRASQTADLLIKKSEEKDVSLFSHGFFLYLVMQELKRRSWKCKRTTPFQYLEVRTLQC